MVGFTASHYENFPVASILLPREMRRHIAAIYAFARTADDFADEGQVPDADRLRRLDAWQQRLHRALRGEVALAPEAGEPADTVPLFAQLAATIHEKALPAALFEALLSAFRQDVTVHRYESWSDLLDYCRRSADPVGRLVLRVAGYRDDRLDRWSDAVCTALQLTNFWQDLRMDVARDRVYVPREDMQAHGVDERGLCAASLTQGGRALMATLVSRTRVLFEDGRPVCDAVPGRLRLELRATWLGGMRILDRIEAAGCDALASRPVIGAADLPWFAMRMLTWRAAFPASARTPVQSGPDR